MHPPHIGGGLGGGGCFFASFFAPKKARNCPFLKEGVGDDGEAEGLPSEIKTKVIFLIYLIWKKLITIRNI